jgi:hypothetical protein
LALKSYEPAALNPRNVTPKQMMAGLMEGVAVAKPPEVAAYMLKPGVRAFGF